MNKEEEALRKWQASFDAAADDTLFSFERVADLLTDQVKVRQGVAHMRSNWPRFKQSFLKLQDIFDDMTIYVGTQPSKEASE